MKSDKESIAESQFNVTGQLGTDKGAIVVKVSGTMEEKAGPLYLGNREGVLRTRSYPLKAPEFNNENSFEKKSRLKGKCLSKEYGNCLAQHWCPPTGPLNELFY